MKATRLLLAAVMLGALSLVPVTGAEAATATKVSARTLLFRLAVATEAGSSTYDRAKFNHWIDANGDCQDTRAEVLIAESRVAVTYTSSSRCAVAKGKWYSWYDGSWWTRPSDLDIDHMVALKEAWESGARAWTVTDRTRYANDLGFAHSLVAVTDNVNQSKSDRDPAEWLPAKERCTYAIRWVQVKYRWRLTVDISERSKLGGILTGACGSTLVLPPTRAR